jgi:hypothetical protein
MNMNSYPAWDKYVKKNSMHIQMLIFCKKYVILVSTQTLVWNWKQPNKWDHNCSEGTQIAFYNPMI